MKGSSDNFNGNEGLNSDVNTKQQKPKNHYTEIIVAIVGLIGVIITALISQNSNKKDLPLPSPDSFCETRIVLDPRDKSMWNDSKEKYIWFNAQYRNANDSHDKNHYDSIVKHNIKVTFILIQPNKSNKNDYINFIEKLNDFRKFLRKKYKQGIEEGYLVAHNFGEIYLFKEEHRPAISFFLTKSRKHNKYKAIIYIEDKSLMSERRPQLCFETFNLEIIESLKHRADDLIESATTKNKLSFNLLITNAPNESFLLDDTN